MAAPPGHRPSSPTMPPSGPRKRRWSRRAVMVSTAAAATSLLGLVLLLGFPSSYRAGSMSVLSWPSSSSPPPPLDRISLASSGSEADCPGRSLAFSFDAAAGQHAAWMASVPDATPLTSLSIPGSHDSLTYNMAADGPLRCQNANLSAQLAAGLRYVDVRVRLRDDDLRVYHADGDTGFRLADVLALLFAFLDGHPSEAVVMRLKEEGPPLGRHDAAVSFESAFNRLRRQDPGLRAGAARHLRLVDDGDGEHPPAGAALLPLGRLRGQVVLLQDFAAAAGPDRYGLAWDGPHMALEDAWIVPDLYHLADKWVAVRDALERAAREPLGPASPLYLAHVSASVGVTPIDAAAGPCHRAVTGLNDMTAQWLLDYRASPHYRPRLGIVILDFPGRRAVEAVLAWNPDYAPRMERRAAAAAL